jgi:1-acyl-sn-glycerol-3-phosphate acyltransferase
MTRQVLNQMGRYAIGMYARLMLEMNVTQQSPLPECPKIIAPNHPTTIDPFLTTLFCREPVNILVTESAFKAPLFGRYLKAAGHIPVMTGSGKEAFEVAKEKLLAGQTVAIFPEGALSPLDGQHNKPHTGVARLSLLTGAPIIPVGIAVQRARIRLVRTGITNSLGQEEIARFYSHAPYAVTLGAPLYLTGDIEDREYVRGLSAHIMREINRLSKQSAYRMAMPAVGTTIFDTAELPVIH